MDQLILRVVMQRSLESKLRQVGDRPEVGRRHHPMNDSLFHLTRRQIEHYFMQIYHKLRIPDRIKFALS